MQFGLQFRDVSCLVDNFFAEPFNRIALLLESGFQLVVSLLTLSTPLSFLCHQEIFISIHLFQSLVQLTTLNLEILLILKDFLLEFFHILDLCGV